jgi:hypothetical protein
MTKSLAALYWFKINGRRRQRPETRLPPEDALPFPDAEDDRAPEFPDKPPSLWCRLWSNLAMKSYISRLKHISLVCLLTLALGYILRVQSKITLDINNRISSRTSMWPKDVVPGRTSMATL